MTHRSLLAAALICAGTVAQAGGPSIAYVKAGSTADELFLVEPNGTALTKLYTTPRKTRISTLDLRPSGNEIAFSQQWRIYRLKYLDNGRADGTPVEVQSECPAGGTMSAYWPDYHPSGDGRLVFIVACPGNFSIWQSSSGSEAAQRLFTTVSTNRVRWNAAGTHLYYDEETVFNSGIVHLKRRDMATGAVEDLGDMGCQSGACVQNFEVTRTGDRLVWGPGNAPRLFDRVAVNDVSESTTLCVVGGGDEFHFSPTDAEFAYRTPHSASGDYILRRSSTCSGSPNALTGKGSWGRLDWRN